MVHHIQNEQLRIGVKTTGAELCSLVSQTTGQEYMWQADPAYWASHAPVLFPIVGGLKNGQYRFDGKTYALPKHGIVRYNEKVILESQEENSLTFLLLSDADSRLQYPFDFAFRVRFVLEARRLTVHHEVHNTGSHTMYFSLGAHPAFRCPLHAHESYEDYFLEFEQTEQLSTWLLNDAGLVASEGPVMLDHSKMLPLHAHLFDQDALIFKQHPSQSIALKSKRSAQILQVEYSGWPYLGIWAKPGAPFVCIEPWLGIADSAGTNQELPQKEGILSLKAGKIFQAVYSILIQE